MYVTLYENKNKTIIAPVLPFLQAAVTHFPPLTEHHHLDVLPPPNSIFPSKTKIPPDFSISVNGTDIQAENLVFRGLLPHR